MRRGGHVRRTTSVVSSRPAIEYNTGRTLTRGRVGTAIAEPGEPVSDTASRVLCGLTGLWIAQGLGCRPNRGVHLDGCPHIDDWFGCSLRALARATFGRDDGPATAQVRRALVELASKTSQVLFTDPKTGRYLAAVVHLGEVVIRGRLDHPGEATVSWGWSASMGESLRAGRYQQLPAAIVRGLRGSAWRVASFLLQHPGVASMRKNGWRSFELRVGAKDLQRFGLAGLNRPAKVRNALERAAEACNELQDQLHIDVVDAVGGGFKFRMTDPAKAVASPVGASTQGRDRVNLRTLVRQREDAIVLTSGPPDMFETARDKDDDRSYGDSFKHEPSLRSGHDDPEGGVGKTEAARRADAIEGVLLGSGLNWLPASRKQRAYIEAIESRAITAGCSLDDHLEIIEQGIRDHLSYFEERDEGQYRDEDPLGDLIAHDDVVHPRKPVAASVDDPIREAWASVTDDPVTPEVEKAFRALVTGIGLERAARLPAELLRSYVRSRCEQAA